ncbi:hypothetical protein [Rhizobium phage RHEph26]|nr:hypothetical protein [Rhizobium phage RHEph26]
MEQRFQRFPDIAQMDEDISKEVRRLHDGTHFMEVKPWKTVGNPAPRHGVVKVIGVTSSL